MSEIKVENPFHPARFKPKRKGKKPPKLLAVVHQAGCTGCEVCIQGCPVDSIELVAGPNPLNPTFQQTVEIDLMRCIGCQNCSQDCPWDTITMYQHEDAYTAWGNENYKSELYIPLEELKKHKSQVGFDELKAQVAETNEDVAEETETKQEAE